MSTRLLYLYSQTTKEYVGFITQRESPLEPGVFFDISDSTTIQPPAFDKDHVAVFIDGKWDMVEDHRGQTWYDTLGKPHVIKDLGTPPSELKQAVPIELLREYKKTLLSSSCSSAILYGFGKYPCSPNDQMNILLASINGGRIWRKNEYEAWSFIYHDKKQAEKVLLDMISHIQSKQSQYADLLVKIDTSSSIEEIVDLTWE